MKTTLMLSLLLAVPALAGTQVVESTPPPPVQDTWSWFAGATGGYLFEAEEDIYTLQLGAKSPWSVAGWSVSLFAEVGWTENNDGFDLDGPFNEHVDTSLDIVPVTFNVQFEHMFSNSWSAYIGGGVGAAYVSGDFDNVPDEFNDNELDDWTFTGQVFAGVAYHFSPSFEIFGGGRWIYFEDPGSSENVSLGNDWMLEGGVRFHF